MLQDKKRRFIKRGYKKKRRNWKKRKTNVRTGGLQKKKKDQAEIPKEVERQGKKI